MLSTLIKILCFGQYLLRSVQISCAELRAPNVFTKHCLVTAVPPGSRGSLQLALPARILTVGPFERQDGVLVEDAPLDVGQVQCGAGKAAVAHTEDSAGLPRLQCHLAHRLGRVGAQQARDGGVGAARPHLAVLIAVARGHGCESAGVLASVVLHLREWNACLLSRVWEGM